MKRVLKFLFVLIFSGVFLTACESINDSIESDSHVHTYSNNYSYDENMHWFDATCCENVKKDMANHYFLEKETNDGTILTCSVCKYQKKVKSKYIVTSEEWDSIFKNTKNYTLTESFSYDNNQYSQNSYFTEYGLLVDYSNINNYELVKEAMVYQNDDKYYACTLEKDNDYWIKQIITKESFDNTFLDTNYNYLKNEFDNYNYDPIKKLYSLKEPIEIDKVNENIKIILSDASISFENGKLKSINYEITFKENESIETAKIDIHDIGTTSFSIPSNFHLKTSSGDEYILSNEGYELFKANLNQRDIKIPEELDGYPVVAILDDVFMNDLNLVSIEIPGSIKYIGKNAFNGCENLSNLILDDGIENILDDAFRNCNSLVNIKIPGSVVLNEHVFSNCKSLERVILEEGIEEISYGLFSLDENLKYVKLPSTLVTISNNAFKYCSSLESITLPNNLTEILPDAFSECSMLSSIEFPESLSYLGGNAFTNCIKIEEVIFPKALNEIGMGAFSGCTNLSKVEFLNDLEELPMEIFAVCNSLTSICLPKNIKKIGTSAFARCVNLESVQIGDKLESIGTMAFYSTKIKNLVLPETMLEILDFAFSGCNDLETINLPSSIKKIDNSAFNCCNNLKSINIPSSLTILPENVFGYCMSLTKIFIPKNIKSIYYNSFYNCNSLEEIIVDENNLYYNSNDNCNAIIETSSKKLVLGCKNTKIPDDIKIIGSNAFSGTKGIKKISLPKSVTKIEDGAFSDCLDLEEIVLNEGLISIGRNAFSQDYHITKLVLPESVQSVYEFAFFGCYFKDIIILSTNIKIGRDGFLYCNNIENVYYIGNPSHSIKIYDENILKHILYYSEEKKTDSSYSYWHYVNNLPEKW